MRGTGRPPGPSIPEERETVLRAQAVWEPRANVIFLPLDSQPWRTGLVPFVFTAESSELEQRRCVRCAGPEQAPGTAAPHPPPYGALPCFGMQPGTGTIFSQAWS